MTDINDGLPPNDLRLFLRTISMATPEQVIRLGRESADHIDALEANNKALVEALVLADNNLTNLQPKIANGLVHEDWVPVFDSYIERECL